MSECFFDYKIKKIFGDDGIRSPKLYFERDYHNPLLPYHIFAVPEEWTGRYDVFRAVSGKTPAEKEKALSALDYDTVRFVYDIKGIDCVPLTNSSSKNFKKAEIKGQVKFEDFWGQGVGCRIVVEDKDAVDHSGVGVLEMLKNGNPVAKFFFAVNFIFRKKISYRLDYSGNKISMKFICPDRPQNIFVKLLYNRGRLPCLKDDVGVNVVHTFELDFSRGAEFNKTLSLVGEAADGKNAFFVVFSDFEAEKYYLLDCLASTTAKHGKGAKSLSTVNDACPYCHRAISPKLIKSKGYRSGGIACNAFGDKGAEKRPDIRTKKNVPVKRALYCASDLQSDNPTRFSSDSFRLLPADYLSHDRYKIAFVGSTRAGKTTYISRFFDVSGDDRIGMPMVMTQNGLQNFGVSVKAASIPKLSASTEISGAYIMQDTDWTDTNVQYTSRSINLAPPRYPKPTSEGDYTKYPFITEVNGTSYVSFYDIAGEDAKYSKLIANIANQECIGVFCIINGKKDINGNHKVSEMLSKAKLDKNCPVAVILTKMDILEGEFDSNCHCLRTDYLDGSCTTYEGSAVENEIDIASEEIRSYLERNNLLPSIESDFNNIKYFGVSSFNFLDGIHSENEDVNEPGKVKFLCSSKRMEMPFLWMLKQFGIII